MHGRSSTDTSSGSHRRSVLSGLRLNSSRSPSRSGSRSTSRRGIGKESGLSSQRSSLDEADTDRTRRGGDSRMPAPQLQGYSCTLGWASDAAPGHAAAANRADGGGVVRILEGRIPTGGWLSGSAPPLGEHLLVTAAWTPAGARGGRQPRPPQPLIGMSGGFGRTWRDELSALWVHVAPAGASVGCGPRLWSWRGARCLM